MGSMPDGVSWSPAVGLAKPSYDYERAARDAIHFAALVDRIIQNLRRNGRAEPRSDRWTDDHAGNGA